MESKERDDHKYVARIPVGKSKISGRPLYRYFYTMEAYRAYLKGDKTAKDQNPQTTNTSVETALGNGKSSVDGLLGSVKQATENSLDTGINAFNKLFGTATETATNIVPKVNDYLNNTDADNKYDMNSKDREEKLKQVAQDEEWKEIVKNKDPEYVKKVQKEDGSYEYEYDIDKYVVNKKHPVLDAADDLVSNRKIDTHKVTKDSFKAGVKDYVVSAAQTAGLAIKLYGGFLTTKFKMQSGAYDEEMEVINQKMEDGKEYVKKSMTTVDDVSTSDIKKALDNKTVDEVIKTVQDEEFAEKAEDVIKDRVDKTISGVSKETKMLGKTTANKMTNNTKMGNLATSLVAVGMGIVDAVFKGVANSSLISAVVNAVDEYREAKAEEERKAEEEQKKQEQEYQDLLKEQQKREEEYRKEREQAEKEAKENLQEQEEQSEEDEWEETLEEAAERFPDLELKDEPGTDEEDMEEINPNYDPEGYEYSNNCAYCTASYELRQRGYDVEANPIPYPNPNDIYEIMSWYENPEPYSMTQIQRDPEGSAEYLESELVKQGDGARGQFCLYWADGGGHSVVYEVVNNDVVIRDCQTNQTVDLIDYMQYSSDVTFFRTDNLELTDEILKTARNNRD